MAHYQMPEKQDTQHHGDDGSVVEPRTSLTEQQPSHRSIGMHAILNPSNSQPCLKEPLNEKKHGLESSPAFPSQITVQRDQSASSRQRRIISPISPSAHGMNLNTVSNGPPGTINAVHSPFLQSPGSQGSASASSSQEGADGPKGHFSSAFRRFSHTYPPQLTPPYDDRRLSSGELSDPRSQTGSPSTPQSLYAQFNRESPGPVQGPPQQRIDPSQPSPNACANNWSSSFRQSQPSGEHQRTSFPQLAIHNGQGLIPIEIDVESASSRANEKRSNNRDASKRHRDRKKDAEAEKARTMELQEQKIKFLTEERDHYQSELEYFRDIVNRTTGLGRIPPRPLSPRHRQPNPLSSSKAASEKTSSQQQERGNNGGRNTRRKLNQEQHSKLPTPPSGASLAPLPPLNYTMAPVQQPYPASSWPVGAVRSHPETGPSPQHHQITPYPPHETHSQVSVDRSWNPAS